MHLSNEINWFNLIGSYEISWNSKIKYYISLFFKGFKTKLTVIYNSFSTV